MNKKIALWMTVLAVPLFACGCSQNQQGGAVAPAVKEDVSNASLSAAVPAVPESALPQADIKVVVEDNGEEASVTVPEKAEETALNRPGDKEIQQALKNAGLYEGKIDGKIGPKSKRAIEEFQAKNSLKVDGKVGPNTWRLLREYLNAGHDSSAQESGS